MAFKAARAGLTCLYFTTLAEPPLKLMRYMQRFEFFDADMAIERLLFVDLASVLRSGDTPTLDEIAARVQQQEPGLVIIDSFRARAHRAGDRCGPRGAGGGAVERGERHDLYGGLASECVRASVSALTATATRRQPG